VDKITTGLLGEFCKNFDLTDESEDVQFENFATYLTTRPSLCALIKRHDS
jgi:hypothetical protein